MKTQERAILNALARLESEHEWPTWKCAKVISGAQDSIGKSQTGSTETESIFAGLYLDLIALAKDGTYLRGQGNLGIDGGDPAPARNTECYLTDAGRELTGSSYRPPPQKNEAEQDDVGKPDPVSS